MEKFYSVEQVAKMLQVSTNYVYAMVERGAIDHIRLGRVIRIPRAAITRLGAPKAEPAPEPAPEPQPEPAPEPQPEPVQPAPEPKPEVLIVTQHPALTSFFLRRGIRGRIMTRARVDDVRGKIVYGILPRFISARAKEFYGVEFRQVPPKALDEMTTDEMELYGGHIVRYPVGVEVIG